MDKFFILRIEHKSVWEVVAVDKNDPVVKEGWINALCLDPGEEHKAFVGSKLGIPAMTIFGSPDKWDVSKRPFHLTPEQSKTS